MEYEDFLKAKAKLGKFFGFDVEDNEMNDILFPHQKDIVKWALKGGRRAIFAQFGLGKSFMQLEILRIIGLREKGCQLIIAPLGVIQEFKTDADKLNIEIKFIRRTEELEKSGMYITNYESVRDGRLDINKFNGVSLDEAAVLRSYGSKTFQTFLTNFESVKYRFVATATPSPNRYKELIHYAGFLGIQDTGLSLTKYFQRDSTKANNLTLYPHMEKEFWLWLSSWAVFLNMPSDMGYSDEGYVLPEIIVHWHCVRKENSEFYADRKTGQFEMFPDTTLNLQSAAFEKRTSIDVRIEKMKEILNNNKEDNFIVWHDQEAERHSIKKAVPEVVEIYGSLDLETREQRVIDFGNGKFKYIATKPILSGSGVNWQRHCNKAIYLGISFKFADFIQSVHRIHRFQQQKQCEIHIIYSENEKNIVEVLKKKWNNHERMVKKMTDIIKKHGLSCIEMSNELARSMGVKRIESSGKNWKLIHNDCVEETKTMEENSVDMILTSIPFGNHYEYTPSLNDFGHTEDNDHFWKQMDFLTPNLLKVLKPGRIYACHVKDRVLFGNTTGKGVPTVSPFHMEATFHAMKHGFDYLGMITIVTDVVRENNQTYRLGWTEKCKDGSKMGVGSPEYVLLLRKPQTDRSIGFADQPVKKDKKEYSRARWQIDAHAFWRSSGNRQLDIEELSKLNPETISKLFTKYTIDNVYDYESHVKIGENLDLKGCLPTTFMTLAPGSSHPEVWTDVNRMHTLNSSQGRKCQVKHICPFQIDVVERLIERYSMKDDVVFDPFGGLGTTALTALKMGRKGLSTELNPQSYIDSVKYLELQDKKIDMPLLFDAINVELAS